jgi:ubiquinone/menaquinone biosynthesis C-methylase UbiE
MIESCFLHLTTYMLVAQLCLCKYSLARMAMATDAHTVDEAARIRAVYARRDESMSYSFFEIAQLLAVQERERKLLALLKARGIASLEQVKILEIGCGDGLWLRQFVNWGARPERLTGIDLLPARIERARALCPAKINLQCGDASSLGFSDGQFDIVFQSTIFTSILDRDTKRRVAFEMLRVLRPEGLVLWYDFYMNNPANPDVRGVGKSEIERLFPNCNVSLQKLTLAPPIGRRVAPISTTLYRALSQIKPLCTHYLGSITKL